MHAQDNHAAFRLLVLADAHYDPAADATAPDATAADQKVKLDTVSARPPNPEGCDCTMGLGPAASSLKVPLLLLGLVLLVWGWRSRR